MVVSDRTSEEETMHSVQRDVQDFHEALDILVGDTPAIRRPALRASLIMEEAVETVEAITGHTVEWHLTDERPATPDLVGAIDGLCDLLAVTYGAAVEFGIDLEPFWDEVHRSNMAKRGGPVREDGKRLKPLGWEPPDIAGLLHRLYEPEDGRETPQMAGGQQVGP